MNDHERQAVRRATGGTAEDLAAAAYERAGARIIGRNHRLKCGELDLIVEEKVGSELVLVFVEVRARSELASWETPAESLTPSKLRKLRNAASSYLASYRGPASSVRFDLASWDLQTLRLHRNFWWY
jgi:putative endonuclease